MSTLSFPLLTAERYADATNRAKALIRERAEQPEFRAFRQQAVAHYSRWLTLGLQAILAIVMTAAFVFSAGKQIAVFSLFIDGLPGEYNRLSSGWASAAIASSLLVSELDSILFAISAGVLAEGTGRVMVGKLAFSPVALLLRTFSIGCAALALIINVAIAAIDTPRSVAAVSWFTSLMLPLIVLGIGLVVEQIVLASLRQRAKQKAEYETALRDYHALVNDPTIHAAHGQILTSVLFEELTRLKKNRESIDAAFSEINGDRSQMRAMLCAAEIRAHSAGNALALEAQANPFYRCHHRNRPG